MKRRFKSILAMGLSLVMLGSLAGCSSNQNNTNNNPPAEETEVATRVVSTIKGDVTILENPQRIVDISGSTEELVLLGENVVGTANIDSYATDRIPSYMEEDLPNVQVVGHSMLDTADIEAILALEPDLIMMGQRQENIYDQLKAIAPTIMIKEYNNDWESKFIDIATIFDKKDVARAWLDAYKAEALALGDEIEAANGEDTTYLAMLAGTGQFWVFSDAGIGSILYDDMELNEPDNLPEQEDISLPVINLEGLADINADVILAIAGQAERDELAASTVWAEVPAVKAQQVILLDQSPYFTQSYNPIGRKLLLVELRDVMLK